MITLFFLLPMSKINRAPEPDYFSDVHAVENKLQSPNE